MMRLICLAVVLLASPLAAQPEPRPGQLPADVIPIHYDIRVDPDAKALRFSGEEAVIVSVARPTPTIVLNAADLAVTSVRFDGAPLSNWSVDEKSQRLTIALGGPARPGAHRLEIAWTGKIAQSAAGLFAIDYNDARGAQRMLVTQFEASDARRFAPMWDEPGRKATFTLSTTAPQGQTAFSNMPVATTAAGPAGKTLVTFQRSPRMSSYLLFLGIGDVERRTTRLGPTEIGVITRRGAGDQGLYALASAKRILAYYNDYFGTPYPLPKLDMIAGPGTSQFFGAMENWGAIFYFDRDILVDPALSTESDRQGVFITVAHEMAHQWFGDLVTMSWWDDIWLNEGYASWMSSKATADLNPDWRVQEQEIGTARQSAFQVDSRQGSHPIVQRIDTPDQVNQAFDTITYQKGQAVIRMLEGAVGPNAFRDGVRRYMAAHKYGNTATDDLWASISAAAGKPVKPLMDAFTLQSGVPLIRVGDAACVAGATTLPLSQDRYATDAASKSPRTWPVPVAIASGPAVTRIEVSGPSRHQASIAGCAPAVVNAGQYGYYRTLYTPRDLEALGDAYSSLPLSDQVGMLSDRVFLANAGYAPFESVLRLIDRIPESADPLDWSLIAERFALYDRMLDGDPAQGAFRAKASALLSPQLARVGLLPKTDEAPPTSQLREALIESLGEMGDPRMTAEARRMVAQGMDHIPAAIRRPIVTVFGQNATPQEWDMLHAAARSQTNPLVREALYSDLGAPKDDALAQRALDLAMTDEAPTPLRATIISSVADRHPSLAFDWAVARADRVNALVEPSSRQEYIPRLAAAGNDTALADRVEAYAARVIPAAERRSALVVIANVRYGAEVKARARGPLAVWSAAH